MKKRILFSFSRLVLLALILLFLVACGQRGLQIPSGVSVQEIGNTVSAVIDEQGEMEDTSPLYLQRERQADPALYADAYAKKSMSGSPYEYGIFSCTSAESAALLTDKINASLDRMRAEWDSRYHPEAADAIEAASAHRFGNYVLYYVLPADKSNSLMQRLRNI